MTGGDATQATTADAQSDQTDDPDLDEIVRGLKGQWKPLIGALLVGLAFVHSITSPGAAISAFAWEVIFGLAGLLLLSVSLKWAWEDARRERTAVPTGNGV